MISQDKFAIIADDYTGAGDSGIHFPRVGRRVDLLIQGDHFAQRLRACDAISLTTESRFMRPDAAAAKLASTVEQCLAAGFTRFYKKMDSTLRGNPGSEIEAFLNVTGQAAALICTAIPEIGRICRNGEISLNGAPLHATETGRDPFNPITTSSVVELLGRQSSLPARVLRVDEIEAGPEKLAARIQSLLRSGVRLIVADAITDAHLSSLAAQIDAHELLPAGASGFARALARRNALPGCEDKAAAPAPQGPLLAVIGSLSGVSREQAEAACQSGRFLPFEIQTSDTRDAIEAAFLRLMDAHAAASPNILLRIAAAPGTDAISKAEGERVAGLLGEAAAIICRHSGCRTVYSTGGGTSMGVALALGVESVTLMEELKPGVALGACSAPKTAIRWFISKAGGFGARDILTNIADAIGAAGAHERVLQKEAS